MDGLDGMETSSKSIAVFDVFLLISLVTLGGCVFAHGVADGELLHVPLLLAGCRHAGTGYHPSPLICFKSFIEGFKCYFSGYHSPSNAISQVIIPMDDDVTVLNRPVETKYYSPPPDHVHTEVNLWLVPVEFILHVYVSHFAL